MTTSTVPKQAKPESVPTEPTRDDASALIQLAQLHAQMQVSNGLDIVWRDDFPSDAYTIDAWYPPGTDGRRGLQAVLVWFQTAGTLVKHGLLHPGLCEDWSRADLVWARIRPMALADRSKTGDDTLWANFELLAGRQRKSQAAATV